MAEVLFVGKPIEPPWNDSSKNLARDLATSLERHVPVVLGRAGAPELGGRVKTEPSFGSAASGFSPAMREKARLLARVARGREPLAHFFFAPNPLTSTAARAVLAPRRTRTVHTLCSAPADSVDLRKVLFADAQVVLSRHTEERLLAAGIDRRRIVRIAPSIPRLEVPSAEERMAIRRELQLPTSAFLVVYPGDLEFGRGAETMIEAVASLPRDDLRLVVACRTKTPKARERDVQLRALARTLGVEDRVVWMGETRRIHGLLGCADVVALPTDTLYAKMDLPLVLLEAMAMERPVLVASGTAAEELADEGGAMPVACDVEAVAASLDRLSTDGAGCRALGKLGRARVLRQHTAEAMAKRYEDLYDELLTGSR